MVATKKSEKEATSKSYKGLTSKKDIAFLTGGILQDLNFRMFKKSQPGAEWLISNSSSCK